MLVKELREKLRLYRKEDLKPVSLMKKEEVVRELEKYESRSGVAVEVKVEDVVEKGTDVEDVKKEKKATDVKKEATDVKKERKVKITDPVVEVKQEVEVVKKEKKAKKEKS